MTKQFQIGLSYPRELRNILVREVAQILALRFMKQYPEDGQSHVLYDEFHRSMFNQPRLRDKLPLLYRDECEVIVVFLCAEYANRHWCGLEWEKIRELASNTDSCERIYLIWHGDQDDSILKLLGLDRENDGFIDIDNPSPVDIAKGILIRLGILNPGHPIGGGQIAREIGSIFMSGDTPLVRHDRIKNILGLKILPQQVNKTYFLHNGLLHQDPLRPTPNASYLAEPEIQGNLYSLMVQIYETGEDERIRLIPELQVIPQDASDVHVIHLNDIPIESEVLNLPAVGRQLQKWLAVSEDYIQQQSSDGLLKTAVLLELFLPTSLLLSNVGHQIQFPSLRTRPLATEREFMVRSLDRALDRNLNAKLLDKWSGHDSLKKLLLVHDYCISAGIEETFDSDLWHEVLYNRTQVTGVGAFVMLTDPPTDPDRQSRLLCDIVDSGLPLVILWQNKNSSSKSVLRTASETASSRLEFVRDLLEAIGLPRPKLASAKELFEIIDAQLLGLCMRKLAKERKNLYAMRAGQDPYGSSHAVILMDVPSRWPQRLALRRGNHPSQPLISPSPLY